MERYDNSFNSWIDKKDVERNSLECNSIAQKWVNIFLNHMNHLDEASMLKLIYLIMQKKKKRKKKEKTDLKNARGIDTSKLATKSDLVSLKAEVDFI